MSNDFRKLRGRDPYDVLGVQRGADRQQLIRAFRWKVRHGGHPDTGGDDQTFDDLTRARDILLDSSRLAAYEADQRAASGRPAHSPEPSMPGPGSAGVSGFRPTSRVSGRDEEAVRVSHPQATSRPSGQRVGGPLFPIILVFLFLFVIPALLRALMLLFVP